MIGYPLVTVERPKWTNSELTEDEKAEFFNLEASEFARRERRSVVSPLDMTQLLSFFKPACKFF
jgi:hypothetical protein